MGLQWAQTKPLLIAIGMFIAAPLEARLLFAWFEAFGITGDYTLQEMEQRLSGMTWILRAVVGVAIVAIVIDLLSGA